MLSTKWYYVVYIHILKFGLFFLICLSFIEFLSFCHIVLCQLSPNSVSIIPCFLHRVLKSTMLFDFSMTFSRRRTWSPGITSLIVRIRVFFSSNYATNCGKTSLSAAKFPTWIYLLSLYIIQLVGRMSMTLMHEIDINRYKLG